MAPPFRQAWTRAIENDRFAIQVNRRLTNIQPQISEGNFTFRETLAFMIRTSSIVNLRFTPAAAAQACRYRCGRPRPPKCAAAHTPSRRARAHAATTQRPTTGVAATSRARKAKAQIAGAPKIPDAARCGSEPELHPGACSLCR